MQKLAKRWKHAGTRVGFVPTMGYLHAGHISLVSRARKLAGKEGAVVVSIYVNPTQFGPAEDFTRYPRDMRRDLALCRGAGVDVVFAPSDHEMYRGGELGAHSTYVTEERLSSTMEGVSRPAHFRGVTTIVAKLFNIVGPDFAVFGAKDYQQAAVVRRMVCDINFPLRVVVSPTLRERDGLAMSSRNKYLEGDLRLQALALWRAMREVRRRVRAQGALPAAGLKKLVQQVIAREPQARLDYVEFFHPDTLEQSSRVARGTHMALAVYVGSTRLIDNMRL
jgi:pantoate--beta-alanine ligase